MARSQRELWYVALKVFLERDDKFLVFKDRHGDWDIPGGRIQRHEFRTPLERIIARKMGEELGPLIRYQLGKPVVFMRHERREISLRKKVRIFAVGYVAKYIGGAIRLSPEHTEHRWVTVRTFRPGHYFTGGWLKGVQDYLGLRRR